MNELLDQILPLGNPHLRVAAEPVRDLHEIEVQNDARLLKEVLDAFRAEFGFGRAIAAPQIGVPRRMIAMHSDGKASVLYNPTITWESAETFTMWDDCMCFPDLLIRVRRHRHVSVKFRDEDWHEHVWNDLDQSTSELLQHEIDHLDGKLALQRAIDQDSIISRRAFDEMPEYFRPLVDYVIPLPVYEKEVFKEPI